MADKPWKAEERRVAAMLGAKRALMKGTDEKADVDHPLFEVDVKLRKTWSVLKWFKEIKQSADRKNKIPVLTLRQPGQKLRLAVIKMDTLISLMKGAGLLVAEEAKDVKLYDRIFKDGGYAWRWVGSPMGSFMGEDDRPEEYVVAPVDERVEGDDELG